MIGRLAVRSLTAHPVRSAVLAAGFGVGVAVMAILLGVAEIVLEQAQSPALVGGGDVVVRLSPQVPARLLLAGTLQSDALRERVRVASPAHATDLYLLTGDGPEGPSLRGPSLRGPSLRGPSRRAVRIDARGGIPSLERALGDPETSQAAGWRDMPADVAWTRRAPDDLLRQIDAFHPIPRAPDWEDSWAEWLYFNGRSPEGRFYLTFIVGPRLANGLRAASVRLQLERGGRMESYSDSTSITEEAAMRAPDLIIGASSVRLDGMRYRIRLNLPGERSGRVVGDLTLHASPGRLVPPVEIGGARNWRTGYVVPITTGPLEGSLLIRAGEQVSFDGGIGYHDHNWGFWDRVSWQWGQVQHDDLSFIYGRVFPPREAADPERMPGVVLAIGPDGPLGFATNVQITETNDPGGRPRTIDIRAVGAALELTFRFEVDSLTTTRMAQFPLRSGLDFLQMRGTYRVTGRAAARTVDFTAPGSAETFRGSSP